MTSTAQRTRWTRDSVARVVVIIAGLLTGGCAADEAGEVPKSNPEHSLGSVNFAISCSVAAQEEFNHGVALLHHMTYPQAREVFGQVAQADPSCAMPHWGIAMTLFQPLWPSRPGPEDLQRGWEEVQKATALGPPTERERQYVAAAEAFFRDPSASDYRQRLARWDAAMAEVYAANPQDEEAAAFYALSRLSVAPSDVSSLEHWDRAAKIILSVYERNPNHPGAMHYLIHANDVPGREQELLEVVRKYGEVAPRNPHALHMPTHIYTRLGDWDRVIAGNLDAADAALNFPAGDSGQWVWDEFPHAIEYLVYGYLQKAADGAASAQLRRLLETPKLQPGFKTAFHLASTQARFALERRAWEEAAELTPRQPASLDWDRFPWAEAVTWFARGMGSVHEGRKAEAREAGRQLVSLEARAADAGEDLFARNIRVLRLGVEAWIAQDEGRADAATALMRQAAELEASTPKDPVTPAPTLPAYELLGDLLFEQKRPADALGAYQRSLEQSPRRFNSLVGAARAAAAAGDKPSARAFYDTLLEVATGGDRSGVLEEARAFRAQD